MFLHNLCLTSAALALLAAPALAACPPQMPAAPQPLSVAVADSSAFSAAVVAEVNRYRCAAGLAPVALDRRATRASRGHSLWMAEAGRMTHDSTAKGRETLQRRLRAEGVAIRRGGYESIGDLRFYSVQGLDCHSGRPIPTEAALARRIVAMWIESPSHRRLLLAPRATQAGAAAAVRTQAQSCGAVFLTIILFG